MNPRSINPMLCPLAGLAIVASTVVCGTATAFSSASVLDTPSTPSPNHLPLSC